MTKLPALLRKLPSQNARLGTGIALLALALPISFFNVVSAGFFFITGLISCLSLVVDWQRLKSLNVSLTSVSAEMFEKIERKVEDAEGILAEIRQVEDRISYILTEQMLNRGGEHYVGGFGEQAKLAIYRTLRETKAAHESDAVMKNLADLKRRVAFDLCHGLFGSKWRDKTSAVCAEMIRIDYQYPLPLARVRELASADNIDINRTPVLLEAYRQLIEEDLPPSEDVAAILYKNKVHGERWADA